MACLANISLNWNDLLMKCIDGRADTMMLMVHLQIPHNNKNQSEWDSPKTKIMHLVYLDGHSIQAYVEEIITKLLTQFDLHSFEITQTLKAMKVSPWLLTNQYDKVALSESLATSGSFQLYVYLLTLFFSFMCAIPQLLVRESKIKPINTFYTSVDTVSSMDKQC